MKSFVLLLLLIGIVFVTIGYSELRIKCPPPRIQYRVLPQSYINEQLSGQSNSELISNLFNSSIPFFRQDNLDNSTINTNSEHFYSTF